MMNSVISFLDRNPVLTNELRVRMRGRRAFIVLAAHLLMLSGIVFLIYLTIYEDTQSSSRYYYAGNFQQAISASSNAGKAIFYGTVLLLLLFVSLVAPGFTAGSLVGEKERQTYDLLVITTLPARSIVLGKLNAIMTYVLLLIAATLPIQSMAYFFGGVALGEVFISILILLVTAFLFCSLGIFISSFANSTTVANMITYALVIPLLVGLPIFIVLTGLVAGGMLFDDFFLSDPPIVLAMTMAYILLLLISINPFSMAIASNLFIVETGNYFFSVERVFDFDIPLIAPWLIYLVVGVIAGILLVQAAIYRVSRVNTT